MSLDELTKVNTMAAIVKHLQPSDQTRGSILITACWSVIGNVAHILGCLFSQKHRLVDIYESILYFILSICYVIQIKNV